MKKLKDIKDCIVGPESTMLDVLTTLNGIANKLTYVVADNNALLGTITDGDIRRALLGGKTSTTLAKDIMFASPLVAHSNFTKEERLELMRTKGLKQLPVVDSDRILLGVMEATDQTDDELQTNTAVIMCGGMGKRMGKLTHNIPKPMLKVGDKPILQRIIENLKECGIRRVFLAINYLGKIIESHFGNGDTLGIEIKYLRESKRLGTAGALSLLPEGIDRTFLVMNGDILTHFSVDKLFDFHSSSKSAATMAIAQHQYQNPFGVVHFDGHKLLYVDEKPIQITFINAGIYMLSPEMLSLVIRDEYMDMPTLLLAARDKGWEVSVCPICEYWTDIGRESDYAAAVNTFSEPDAE